MLTNLSPKPNKCDNQYLADRIYEEVDCRGAIERYTGRKFKHGRMQCPLHGGEHLNFSANAKGYNCFVCGVSGGVISFVKDYFGLSFTDSISKLNEDFGLGLPIGKELSPEEAKAIADRRAKQAEEQRQRELILEQAEDEYWHCLREYLEADAIKRDDTKGWEEKAQATEKLTIYDYLLDQAEGRLAKLRHE